MESKITAKGQMTLPKEAREHLKIKPGDRVKFFIHPEGHLALLPVVPATALKGLLKTKKHATIEAMDKAIREGVVARYRRAIGK